MDHLVSSQYSNMADDSAEKMKSGDRTVVSQKVLFVRNLPFSTTDQDLENVFSEIGPVKRCFVIRNKGIKGLCRGFGYVTFVLAEDAEKAKNDVKAFGGRQLSISFADKKPKHENRKRKQAGNDNDGDDEENANIKDKETKELPTKELEEEPSKKKLKGDKHEEKQTSQKKESGNEIGRTIVITGLASDLNSNHIRKKCRKIGKVVRVTFPVEGREKPTAFVAFESHKDAREAVKKLNGRIFKGNSIEALLLSREGKTPSQKSLKKSKVIVRNLSFKCKEEDLRKFFSQFGQVTEVNIPTKLVGKRKLSLGFGFVQFSSIFEAAKAIKESNMKKIVGRPVAVDWAVAKTVYELKKGQEEGVAEKEKRETEDKDEEKDKGDEKENSEDEVSGSNNEMDSDVDLTEEKLGNSDEEDKDDDDDDDDDGGDDDDGNNDDRGNEDDDEEHEHKPNLQTRKPKKLSDVKEGKTLFIRNISFDSSEEALHELFEQFGEIEYCKLLEDKRTGHSRGMAFVKFKTVDSAEQCLEETVKEGSALSLDNFTLKVTKAVTPGKATELAKERKVEGNKEGNDKRNLYLAKEGLILPGSTAAQGLSKSDLLKRQKAETEKKAKLENPNYFVSPTRLCVRNLPLNVDDKRLKEIFSSVTGRKAHVDKVLIIRSKDRLDSSGRGRSMGYGFVEFVNHKDALSALRATNNNPDVFGEDRRPIVEFSLENSLVVKVKQRRFDKAQQRQWHGDEEHARDEQPKTNKERRLERNQKRKEKRQRQREAKRKRKLEQGNEGDGEKSNEKSNETKASDSGKKVGKKESENSWKAKKGKKSFPAEFPIPRMLEKTDRQNKRKFASIPSNRNNDKSLTTNANSPVADKLSKVKKPWKEREDINKSSQQTAYAHSNAKNEASDRKRKGTRRKEQERKDESNFTDMVNKYKNKLFGKDESETPAKRSRWFDD